MPLCSGNEFLVYFILLFIEKFLVFSSSCFLFKIFIFSGYTESIKIIKVHFRQKVIMIHQTDRDTFNKKINKCCIGHNGKYILYLIIPCNKFGSLQKNMDVYPKNELSVKLQDRNLFFSFRRAVMKNIF